MSNEHISDIPLPDDNHFQLLPINRIVTGVTSRDDADAMVQAAIDAGLSIDHIGVLHGQEAEDFLDLDGSRHGFITKMVRRYQHLEGPEQHLIDQAKAVLANDHFLIALHTDGDEALTRTVFEAISPFAERTIYYCGRFSITYLKIGKDYNHESEYEASLTS